MSSVVYIIDIIIAISHFVRARALARAKQPRPQIPATPFAFSRPARLLVESALFVKAGYRRGHSSIPALALRPTGEGKMERGSGGRAENLVQEKFTTQRRNLLGICKYKLIRVFYVYSTSHY